MIARYLAMDEDGNGFLALTPQELETLGFSDDDLEAHPAVILEVSDDDESASGKSLVIRRSQSGQAKDAT